MTAFPSNATDIRIDMLSCVGLKASMSTVLMEDVWNHGRCRDLADYGVLISDS